jgi:RNAse (barnase) inhibitor barstar
MQIEINANNFSNLDEFYIEVENKLTQNLEFPTGRNLDAFNDILRGGFGVFDYDESIDLIWIDSNKSKVDLNEIYNNNNKTIFEMVIEIINYHDHISLTLK